jgi:glutamate receptor, ionotropic, invertebrate
MNEYKYHYFFTSFDIETFDMEDFKYNFVNITAFRLVDSNDIGIKELIKDMSKYYHQQNIEMFNQSHFIEVSIYVIKSKIFQTQNYINEQLTIFSHLKKIWRK